MKLRIVSFLLCIFIVGSIFSACGAPKEDESAKEQAATNEQATEKETEKAAEEKDSAKQENKSTANKKIVIVQECKDAIRDASQKKILDELTKGGYEDKKNAEITQIQMDGDTKKSPDVVNQIKEIKPDVAIINGATNLYETMGKALEGSGIPTVICAGVDSIGAVDENGKPKGNVTGLYTMPKDLMKNAFNLLNKISPINGKKAVFITTDGIFKKEDVEKGLKEISIELKDYCESKYLDDFQVAVKKYNDDPDVGWMLVGVWPGMKKDGTSGIQVDAAKWDVANRKKPTVTYWDVAVSMGLLCGLGVDLVEVGAQQGEMAVKILSGEKIENVTAQNPRKVTISLNKKTADQQRITFPADVLGSASNVYDKTIND